MPERSHSREATVTNARHRARTAEAYLDVARLVLDEDDAAMNGVATGVAVLAGIAASDAICASRMKLIHRGDNHRDASDLLRTATPDGTELSRTFRRLIDLKDEAHYGVSGVSLRKARNAVRWATLLVDRARDEVER